MKTIIAVGGGEIGRTKIFPDGSSCVMPIETTKIDEFIVKSAKKPKPSMLFIGTATQDSVSYLQIVREHFVNRMGCKEVTPLNIVQENLSYEEIENKIMNTDIIYVGGGDTTYMLDVWKRKGIDKLLYKAYQKGIVLAGISAGAICWFDWYDTMDDIKSLDDLSLTQGLGIIKGFAVPHYNTLTSEEKNKINSLLIKESIKGIALDDCVALIYKDEKISYISCRNDRKFYQIP